MHTKLHTLLVGTACALLPVSAFAQISFLGGASLPNGGEIISFAGGTLLSTNSLSGSAHAVQAYSLTSGGGLTPGLSIDLASVFGGAANISSVTSVLADARGFGVATIVPISTSLTSFGRVAIFSTSTGSILRTLDVGYHPDSVSITPDGSKLLIANEGEFTSLANELTNARAGSVSIITLSNVFSANDISTNVSQSNVSTFDFSAANLGTGVTLNGLRNNRLDTLLVKQPNLLDVEPEFIAATNSVAYITLQEANAIATLDLASGQYTAIRPLGTILNTIDASDRDGPGNTALASRNDTVAGAPMPDTIVTFERAGTRYLVTGNEGDARGDDGDIVRGASANIDTVAFTGGIGNTGIGRLQILRDLGDTDGDAQIEVPTAMGTRSFTIWNAATGAIAFDSGSMIEQYVLDNDPTTHNINSGSLANFDTRSDDKGPEIESVEFASFDGRDFIFAGAERQNGIFQFDITDLGNVFISGYYNTVTGTSDTGGAFISPESIKFIAAADNITGRNIIVVGYEGTSGNGSIAVYGVSAIPEPSTYAALAGAGVLGLAALRRRRSTK